MLLPQSSQLHCSTCHLLESPAGKHSLKIISKYTSAKSYHACSSHICLVHQFNCPIQPTGIKKYALKREREREREEKERENWVRGKKNNV
jgi:hypothetical protein